MIEVADIFAFHGLIYRQTAVFMPPSHGRVMGDIVHCRTEFFGGHVYRCDTCEKKHYTYHSCSNRHCPKCLGKETKRWIEARQSMVLPCQYFHYTFTIPRQLHGVARSHPKQVYGALMTQAAASVEKLALDCQYLGAKPGSVVVLHTWDQKLNLHPHVHFLIPGGGVDQDGTWVRAKYKDYLVPIKPLSIIFRAKMRDAMTRLQLTDHINPTVWRINWVIHPKHAGLGQRVLHYLARYVHRVAITNSRIEKHERSIVIFRYRDRKRNQTLRCHLHGQEFVRRFLQHVLPRGFHKIRYFGILSPSWKKRLTAIREKLQGPQEKPSPEPSLETPGECAADQIEMRCPFCGKGHLIHLVDIPRQKRGPPWY